MAETKKSAEPTVAPPKEIAGVVEEGGAPLALGEQFGAPLPPSGDETTLPAAPAPAAATPAAPPVVTATKGENGTITNQIGGSK
jgi:hypothetical protein